MDDACIKYLEKDGSIHMERLAGNPRNCLTQLQIFSESDKLKRANIIVFSAGFNLSSAKIMDRLINLTRTLSKRRDQRVILMDRTVSFTGFHPEAIKLMSKGASYKDINKIAIKFADDPLLVQVNEALIKSTAGFEDLVVVNKRDTVATR